MLSPTWITPPAPFRRLRVALVVASLTLVAFAVAQTSVMAAAAEPRVQLTAGWHGKTPTAAKAVQYAQYRDQPVYFLLFVHPAADYTDLKRYTLHSRALFEKGSKLANRQQTEPVERRVGGIDTMEYEVTADRDGSLWHYRYIEVRVGDSYCTIECFTKPSRWTEAQPLFDALVKNLK